ncbi:MAG TPA: S41 family peptidase [Bacteroidales bacterium]|nr:S41 family peptidase [Bacteroidales bacterium]HRX97220.1 S41 family peptidase [Bacteroidales bacterium]
MLSSRNFLLAGFLIISLFAHAQNLRDVKSGTSKCVFAFNNDNFAQWRIDSKVNPDRYRFFCYEDQNEGWFVTDIDSVSFSLSPGDTLRFRVILKEKDTAYTEVIGIRELPNTISMEDKLFMLSNLWSEIRYNFMNYENLSFDFDSLYTECVQKALLSANDYEYRQILKYFLASLNDGHSDLMTFFSLGSYMGYAPISLKLVNNQVYIVGYRESYGDRLACGDELIAVNGQPVMEYIENNMLPFISGSTQRFKLSEAVNSLTSGLKNENIHLTFRKFDGHEITLELKRNGEATRYDRNGEDLNLYHMCNKKPPYGLVVLDYSEDSIAHLMYNRFSPEEMAIEEFEKLVPELSNAKGIVIDLRNNRGGSTLVGNNLLKYILHDEYFLSMGSEVRTNDGVHRALGVGYEEYKDDFLFRKYRRNLPDTIWIPVETKRFECPLVILCGELTFSAAEDFLITIYEVHNRPPIVGQPTGGSTGSPLLVFDRHGEPFARICARRCLYPYSLKPFINEGIQPDIIVEETIDNLINGKDVTLEKGFELIREELNSK